MAPETAESRSPLGEAGTRPRDGVEYPVQAQHLLNSHPPKAQLLHRADRRVDDESLKRQCAHLHRLGPRATDELIKKIMAGAHPVERLEACGRLDPAIASYLRADRSPIAEAIQ
jgi:hypothetical protein